MHYPMPGGFAYPAYVLGADRAIHDRQRVFQASEPEVGILQVGLHWVLSL